MAIFAFNPACVPSKSKYTLTEQCTQYCNIANCGEKDCILYLQLMNKATGLQRLRSTTNTWVAKGPKAGWDPSTFFFYLNKLKIEIPFYSLKLLDFPLLDFLCLLCVIYAMCALQYCLFWFVLATIGTFYWHTAVEKLEQLRRGLVSCHT